MSAISTLRKPAAAARRMSVELPRDLVLAARATPPTAAPPATRAIAEVPQAAFGRANRRTSTRRGRGGRRHPVELGVGEHEHAAALRHPVHGDRRAAAASSSTARRQAGPRCWGSRSRYCAPSGKRFAEVGSARAGRDAQPVQVAVPGHAHLDRTGEAEGADCSGRRQRGLRSSGGADSAGLGSAADSPRMRQRASAAATIRMRPPGRRRRGGGPARRAGPADPRRSCPRCGADVLEEARVDAGVAERERRAVDGRGSGGISGRHECVGGVLRLPEVDSGLDPHPVQHRHERLELGVAGGGAECRPGRASISDAPASTATTVLAIASERLLCAWIAIVDVVGQRCPHGGDPRPQPGPSSSRRPSRRRRCTSAPASAMIRACSASGSGSARWVIIRPPAACPVRARARARCAGSRCRPRCNASRP